MTFEVMGVVTAESDGYILPQATTLQIGNEADLTSAAPDHMPAAQYVQLWKLYTQTYEHLPVKFVTCGFASGDVNYWAEVWNLINQNSWRWPDAVAVHPYGKNAGEAQDLLDAYWNVTNIVPVIATEWHQNPGHIWDFQNMLNGVGTDNLGPRCSEWNSWFCYTDAMTLGSEGLRYGLIDEFGNVKPEGYDLVSALGGTI